MQKSLADRRLARRPREASRQLAGFPYRRAFYGFAVAREQFTERGDVALEAHSVQVAGGGAAVGAAEAPERVAQRLVPSAQVTPKAGQH